VPPLAPVPGQRGRLAACWLQEPGAKPPAELDVADPGMTSSPAPARPGAAGGALPPAAVAARTAAVTVAENLGGPR